MKLSVNCGVINNPTSKILGMASVEIGEIVVINNIKIIEGKEGLFLGMPSYKKATNEFKDICYIKNEKAREFITAKVLEEFTRKLEEKQNNTTTFEDGDIPF